MSRDKHSRAVNSDLRERAEAAEAGLRAAERGRLAAEAERDRLAQRVAELEQAAHPAIAAAEARTAVAEVQVREARAEARASASRALSIVADGLIRGGYFDALQLNADEWAELRQLAGPDDLARLLDATGTAGSPRTLRRNLAMGPKYLRQHLVLGEHTTDKARAARAAQDDEGQA